MPAWTTDLDAIHDPATNITPPAAWGDAVADNFAVLGGAWTTFTPTWTGASTNPAIGNGTINAAYVHTGKTLEVRVRVVMGSTTTYGSGDWRFSLPAGLTSIALIQVSGAAYGLDTGTANHVGHVHVPSGATYVSLMSSTVWAQGVPFTWTTGDSLTFWYRIEVA